MNKTKPYEHICEVLDTLRNEGIMTAVASNKPDGFVNYIVKNIFGEKDFDLIKGKRTPSYFKFVFLLSPKNLERTLLSTHSSFTPEDITGMFINLKFQQKKLLLTTGISYRIFSVDKSLDQEWDSLVKRFLTAHEISFEEL